LGIEEAVHGFGMGDLERRRAAEKETLG